MFNMVFSLQSSRACSLGVSILLGIVPAVSTQLTGTGLSVVLNDIPYYISPFTEGYVSVDASSISSASTIYGFSPVTVVQETVAQTELSSLFTNYSASDDVFQDAFTQIVFTDASGVQANTSTNLVLPLNSTISSGPYFLEAATGALHQVYRLYDDFAGAFTTSLIQTPNGTFQPLSAQIASSATLTVGVPSRLYFTKTADKPLAGVRVGVKVCVM